MQPEPPIPKVIRWAGHSHVVRANPRSPALLEHVVRMRELGLNYFGFGHPWEAGDLELIRTWESDPEKLRQYREEQAWKDQEPAFWTRPERFSRWREEYSDADFLFGVDCETPKTRFGHLWWLGWQPEFAPWHDYDSTWNAWENDPRRDTLPYPVFWNRMQAEVIRSQARWGALPVYAHPTSWWWQGNLHVTNIAATLIPDVLTSQAGGCLVVMGYEAMHESYQKLWFGLLDRGYFMTGVAETDACLDAGYFDRALFHNVTPAAGLGEREIIDALRSGHNVMTTGPDLRITCGGASAGDFVRERGGPLRAEASGLDRADSYRIEFVANSRVVGSRRISGVEACEASHEMDGPGWVVARLVNLDKPHDAALTNPVFFGNEPRRVTGAPLPASEFAWWNLPGAMDLCYHLAAGIWHRDFPHCAPGEVPWEAFRWEDWLSLLAREKVASR